MQLSVDYKKIGPEKEKESNMQTTANIISYAIQTMYKDGLDGNGGLRRTYGRIQRKLDQALQDESNVIDLETAEIEMIKKSIQTVTLPTQWSKFVIFLEDGIDNALAQPVAPQQPAPQQTEAQPQA